MKNFDFIEIGTSDFRTIIESSKDSEVGLCVEPLKHYLDKLPNKKNVIKANYALSSNEEEVDIYHIKPKDIIKYNLPNWVRGCNSINTPHPTIKKMLGERHQDIVTIDRVKSITWEQLIKKYNIGSINYLKIDTEGHDGVILLEYYKECIKNPDLKANTILFENNILRNKDLIEEVILKFTQLGYKGQSLGDDYKFIKNE